MKIDGTTPLSELIYAAVTEVDAMPFTAWRDAARQELDRRDAELAQLRARLARLKPLAEAAVAFYCNDGSPDTADALNETACTFGADWISARAQAQDGGA